MDRCYRKNSEPRETRFERYVTRTLHGKPSGNRSTLLLPACFLLERGTRFMTGTLHAADPWSAGSGPSGPSLVRNSYMCSQLPRSRLEAKN